MKPIITVNSYQIDSSREASQEKHSQQGGDKNRQRKRPTPKQDQFAVVESNQEAIEALPKDLSQIVDTVRVLKLMSHAPIAKSIVKKFGSQAAHSSKVLSGTKINKTL